MIELRLHAVRPGGKTLRCTDAAVKLRDVLNRSLRISLAVFWFVWTAVIIPGHTRGIIPLGPSQAAKADCCAAARDKTSSKAPAVPATSNCAICALAATLMPAIAVVFDAEPGALLDTAYEFSPTAPPTVDGPFLCPSRGPPFC